MSKAGRPTDSSTWLSGPCCGDSSRLQAIVFRTPGMISGTSAAARANALNGALVRTTSQASPNPTTMHTADVAAAYPNEFATSVPNPAVVNVLPKLLRLQLLGPTPRKLLC